MFPIGAVIGGLLAARRRQQGPTKALVLGGRYVAQARVELPQAAGIIALVVALPIAWIASSSSEFEGALVGFLVLCGLFFLFLLLIIQTWSRHYLFDERSIEAVNVWGRRRQVRFEQIRSVRLGWLRERLVLDTTAGSVSVPLAFHGVATLSAMLRDGLSEDVTVSRAAQRRLAKMAAAE